jgi:BlaI family transcriptional regulator, penicillinase repressor
VQLEENFVFACGIYMCRGISTHIIMKPHPTLDLSAGEWVIIKALWEREPCTAPDIQEDLQATKNWSYSTVRTMLDRMVAKGLLTTARIRHLTIYRSVITRAQAQRRDLLQTLGRAFNGALTPMVECLLDSDDVTTDELAELEQLIKAKRKQATRKQTPSE